MKRILRDKIILYMKSRNIFYYTVILCSSIIFVLILNSQADIRIRETVIFMAVVSLPSVVSIICSIFRKYWIVSIISLWVFQFIFLISIEENLILSFKTLTLIICNTILFISPIINKYILKNEIVLSKRNNFILITTLLLISSYFIYGYYIGFNTKFIMSNNLVTFNNPEFYSANPDLSVYVNEELLFRQNLPSDRLHDDKIIEEKLRIGFTGIYAYSDSMGVYSSEVYVILYPRKIYIGLYGGYSHKHVSIGIWGYPF